MYMYTMIKPFIFDIPLFTYFYGPEEVALSVLYYDIMF